MNFKVKTSLITKPHNFLKNKPNILNKKGINKAINNLSMRMPRMLIQNNLILNKKV